MIRPSSSVPARPTATASTPTTTGSMAATPEPKTSRSSTSTSGSTTSSERRRSSRVTWKKSWFMAAGPVARISSVSERTWLRMAV